MRTVIDMLQKVEKVVLNDIFINSMYDGKDVFLKSQKEQMYDGIDSDGLAIEPEYTPFTVIMKEAKGQPSSRVTLKDTGDFYNAMYIEKRADSLIVDSKDWKSNALQEKYGDEIFGLDTDYKQQYLVFVQGRTIERLEAAMA